MRYLVLVLTLTLTFTSIVFAESLTVSMQVGTTSVSFHGYTSPYALVLIKEGDSLVGSTSSNGQGEFSHTISVAIPGLHTYLLSATDTGGRGTPSISYDLSVVGNTTTSIEHIVLPPTLSLSGSTLSGETHPQATLTLTSSLSDSITIIPNATGYWQYDLSQLSVGTHILTLTAQVPPSYLSLQSHSLTYTVPPTPTPSVSPSYSPSPSPIPSVTPLLTPSPAPFFLSFYDLNHDGTLSLFELYDIVKNWLLKHLLCDLNYDSVCNLFDLSILLYYIDR